MAQGQGTIQIQKAEMRQLHVTMLQLRTTELLELSALELGNRVRNEVYENDALESIPKGAADDALDVYANGDTNYSDSDSSAEGSDMADIETIDVDDSDYDDLDVDSVSDSLSDAMADYAPDDVPDYLRNSSSNESDMRMLGDTESFFDYLKAQKEDCRLSEQEEQILDYLIGSLDDNGFLDRDLESITDELCFKYYINTNVEEVVRVLRVLQEFDPPGIGARNSKESLLLQIDRLLKSHNLSPGNVKLLKRERLVISDYFDELQLQNKKAIQEQTGFSDMQMREIMHAFRRLNPYPGRPLCESAGDKAPTRYPDFIIETNPMEDTISYRINNDDIPRLKISVGQLEELKRYEKKDGKMSQRERDRYKNLCDRIERARIFVEAIQERRKTLNSVMHAIIDLQRDFIMTQDLEVLHPMVLKDVAEKSGYDISTVSRVFKVKSVEIDGKVYPLSVFKKREHENANGDVIERKQIEKLIREIIASEDRTKKLSDKMIAGILKQHGYDIAPRTVSKYRLELGIASSASR